MSGGVGLRVALWRCSTMVVDSEKAKKKIEKVFSPMPPKKGLMVAAW